MAGVFLPIHVGVRRMPHPDLDGLDGKPLLFVVLARAGEMGWQPFEAQACDNGTVGAPLGR